MVSIEFPDREKREKLAKDLQEHRYNKSIAEISKDSGVTMHGVSAAIQGKVVPVKAFDLLQGWVSLQMNTL